MRRPFATAVVLSCAVLGALLAPGIAHAQTCDDDGEIPFRVLTVDPNVPDGWCLSCAGPWGRASNNTRVDLIRESIASKGFCTFYGANHVAGFEPDGDWQCTLAESCEGCSRPGTCPPPEPDVEFCLGSQETVVSIDLGRNPPKVGARNEPATCLSQSRQSTLVGNDAGARDQDDFAFKGQAGDTVRVTVAPDNKSGHNNGKLFLGSAVNPNLKTKGTLPRTLTDTVPASGDYSVIVKQVEDPGKRFKGTYHVIVESQSGQRIEPLRSLSSVE